MGVGTYMQMIIRGTVIAAAVTLDIYNKNHRQMGGCEMKSNPVTMLMKENVVIVALLVMVLIMAVISPSFRILENLNNIMMQIAIYGIVAFGMTFAIICGEFDLSCGALMGVVTILFTDVSKKSGVIPAILVCLGFCVVIGFINGFLVAKIKMSAFVATLATSIALKGFALNYTFGKPINNVNEKINNFGNGSFLGIPIIVWFFIGVFLISVYVLRYTRFGRGIYATGGSIEVARMAGINVTFYKLQNFDFCDSGYYHCRRGHAYGRQAFGRECPLRQRSFHDRGGSGGYRRYPPYRR